jgi:glyoxylase-like metal-dependent hydrolase (beta-lactamase superfamily II)
MRISLRFFPLVAALSASSLLAQPPATDALIRDSLAPGIYLLRAPSSLDVWTSANAVVIVNRNDVTVFDNSARATTSRLMIGEIAKITRLSVRTMINSHWHMDHWMGNDAFAQAYPGLQIIATTETRDFMAAKPTQYFRNSAGVARQRARLDSAIASGRLGDGTPLTPERRAQMEKDLAESVMLDADLTASRQVLPTRVYDDSLVIRNGDREYRLLSMTGDATASTVLYLPKEKILVTGDVLVRAEDNRGAQPWTTNSYAIAPWLESLRRMEALDVNIIVPGQGAPLYDKSYLRLTIAMYESIIRQVRAASARGLFRLPELVAAVDLKSIRTQFTADDPALNARFDAMSSALIRKAYQEIHDGIAPNP